MWIIFIILLPLLSEFLLNRFIRLIPQISHQFDNPQSVSWQNNSLTTVIEAVSSDVRKLRDPQTDVTRMRWMSLFLRFTTGCESHTLAMCEFRIDDSLPAIYNRKQIPHFYNPFLLQWRPWVISPSAGATLGQRPLSSRIQKVPSLSPLLWGPAYSLAPTCKGVKLRLGAAGP